VVGLLSPTGLTPFHFLEPKLAHQSENRDRKLMLLARRSGETRSWKFDDDTMTSMMARLSPCRMQLLQTMAEDEPRVSSSGVHVLLKVWRRQKRVAVDARGQESETHW
jgi:hypothetical protein